MYKEVVAVPKTQKSQPAKSVTGITRKAFLEEAKKRGVQVYKNNIHLAKPLSEVCGKIILKNKVALEEFLCNS